MVFAWVADPNTKDEVKTAQSRLWELPATDEIEFNRFGELRKAPRLIQHRGHMQQAAGPVHARCGGRRRRSRRRRGGSRGRRHRSALAAARTARARSGWSITIL